ncbi:hypothetical protein GCM10010309_51050 [Streptomyces violaceochromogenes]|nr:hypothetical protein GCM10010309_51050 [Streptomyces violaceochromogenes]
MTGRVQAWVGGTVTGASGAALVAYLIVVGWDKADKVASVLALFVSLAGLAVAVAGVRRDDQAPVSRRPTGDGDSGQLQHTVVNEGGTSYSAMHGNVNHYQSGGAAAVPPSQTPSASRADGDAGGSP